MEEKKEKDSDESTEKWSDWMISSPSSKRTRKKNKKKKPHKKSGEPGPLANSLTKTPLTPPGMGPIASRTETQASGELAMSRIGTLSTALTSKESSLSPIDASSKPPVSDDPYIFRGGGFRIPNHWANPEICMKTVQRLDKKMQVTQMENELLEIRFRDVKTEEYNFKETDVWAPKEEAKVPHPYFVECPPVWTMHDLSPAQYEFLQHRMYPNRENPDKDKESIHLYEAVSKEVETKRPESPVPNSKHFPPMGKTRFEKAEILHRFSTSECGFLAQNESWKDVTERDEEAMKRLGLDWNRVANFLYALFLDPVRFENENWSMKRVDYMGCQFCPFGCTLFPHRDFLSGELLIHRKQDDADKDPYLKISGLVPHLISVHHFLEGSTPYRMDPEKLMNVFGEELLRQNWTLTPKCSYQWSCCAFGFPFQESEEEKILVSTQVDEFTTLFLISERQEKKKDKLVWVIHNTFESSKERLVSFTDEELDKHSIHELYALTAKNLSNWTDVDDLRYFGKKRAFRVAGIRLEPYRFLNPWRQYEMDLRIDWTISSG